MNKGLAIFAASILVFALSVLLLSGCVEPSGVGGKDTTIVYYRGVQCQADPWSSAVGSNAIEKIKSYYAANGIEILNVSSQEFIVCLACDTCPASTEYAATIYEKDKQQMLSLGWKEKPSPS